MKTKPIDPDAPMTTEQCAEWLQITPQTLLLKCSGKNPTIPVYRISRYVLRFFRSEILRAQKSAQRKGHA